VFLKIVSLLPKLS